MASNLKVDIVKPTATNGSLSLKGDSGGSATTNGISVDSSGDTLITGDVGIKISSPTSTLHVKSTNTEGAFNDAINVTPSSGITQGGTIGSRTASANLRQGLFIKSSQALTLWGDGAGDGGKVLSVVHGASPSATDDTDEILELRTDGDLSITGDISSVSSSVTGTATIATADINGGNIDGATIGASSAAAGSFTSVNSTSASLNGAVTINDSGADVDFRVESDTVDHALFVQGSDGYVGIGVSSPADKLHVDGNIRLTSGSGINFSAYATTGNPSSNLLDDYEEGTWTGTLRGSSSEPGTLVTQTGYYTKVGNMVSVTLFYDGSTSGYSGSITWEDLPFNSSQESTGTFSGRYINSGSYGANIAYHHYNTVRQAGSTIFVLCTGDNLAEFNSSHTGNASTKHRMQLTYFTS